MARLYLVFILLVAYLKIGFCLEDISEMSEKRIIELLHGTEDMLQPYVDKCSYDYQSEFVQFKEDYYKSYNGLEEERRLNIFRQNMFKVKLLSKIEQGTAIYGVTKFSDLTTAEFLESYTGLLEKNPADYSHRNEVKPMSGLTVPAELDWRKRGAVTPVKDQGGCGVCYIFAVTGNVESRYAIKNHQLLELSEQELLDCGYYKGCTGGCVERVYDLIVKLGGLETEQEYSYERFKQSTCRIRKEMFKVSIKGYANLTQDEDDMVQHLANDGPIVVSLNPIFLQFYEFGIIMAPENACNTTKLNHSVLIVGYGVERSMPGEPYIYIPYWIIKNSWGVQWGEQGYFRLFRGSGLCGVNKEPSTAIL